MKFSDFVDGDTRFQKLSFLVAQTVKKAAKLGFYSDWIPADYGPFSPSLKEDTTYLCSGYLQRMVKQTSMGYYHSYYLTPKADQLAKEFIGKESGVAKSIKSITDTYAHAPLTEIIHDVYINFPEYTVKSKIRDRVLND